MPSCPQCAINVSLRSKLTVSKQCELLIAHNLLFFLLYYITKDICLEPGSWGGLKVHLLLLVGKLNSQLVLLVIPCSCLQPAATVGEHEQSFCILLNSFNKNKERESKKKLGLLAEPPREDMKIFMEIPVNPQMLLYIRPAIPISLECHKNCKKL